MKYKVFHGSGHEFEQFMVDKARVINDHYGGLLYFTDNKKIAEQYAKGMSKQTGLQVIYEVELQINNLFDVGKEYDEKMVRKILGNFPLEKFARISGLLKFGVDKFQILADLKLGHMNLLGDQIFQGISENQQKTVQARNMLKKVGFDGLKYYGGKITGTVPHSVYLPYFHDAINIIGYEKK